LHRLGFIDKRKMQQYDALCLDPIQDYTATKIKALPKRLHLSQAVLAFVLHTRLPTVRKWKKSTVSLSFVRPRCRPATRLGQ